jgi:hypothetical protein
MRAGLTEGLADWVDPGAVRSLVDSVRDAFAVAPVWARAGLLGMLAFAVITGSSGSPALSPAGWWWSR